MTTGRIVVMLVPFLAILACPKDTRAQQSDFSKVYQAVRGSVVYVVAALPNSAASGSGFIYSSTGSTSTIITANHVVEGASNVDVILDSDPHERYPATIIKRDHVRDVAVLTIPVGNRKALALMDPKKIQEGSDIAVIGYPRAAKDFMKIYGDELRPSVHAGIISAVRLGGEIVQFDAPTDHGDSGGPVIDKATGAVVAIVRGILLDRSYVNRGLAESLPGSNYGMSVMTIDEVLNGAPVAALSGDQGANTSVVSGSGPVALVGGSTRSSSSAYRVGYGAPHYDNPEVETDSQLVLQRLANHFANQNTFYMIPVKFGTATENGQEVSGLCDDGRLNAIVQPGVFWNFPRVNRVTDAPTEVTVNVTLLVTDCSGEPFFADRKTRTERRAFTHRTVDRQVVDIANDLLDQTLKNFDTVCAQHSAVWDSLLKTGIGIDPADARYHSMFYAFSNPETHAYRVYAVFTNGPAAKAGLRVGDVIQSINGQSVAGFPQDEFVKMLNAEKLELVVTRPGGQVTLDITAQKYDQLLSSLGR